MIFTGFFGGLLRGLLWLTVDVIIGFVVASLIMRLNVAESLTKKLMSKSRLPSSILLALAMSLGSSKTAAAIISTSLSRNEITENCAVWSVLMLPFPSYVKRWPGTLMFALATAGLPGAIFALSLLLRSLLRFLLALHMTRRNVSISPETKPLPATKYPPSKIPYHILKTLPLSWLIYALTYSITPLINEYFRTAFSGLSIVSASIGSVNAALTLAGASLETGTISPTMAVFSLILGSGVGTATRLLRQNAGYYYALFPRKFATRLLLLNFATIMTLILLNLIFAGLALLLWP